MEIINNTKNSIFISSERLIKNKFIRPGERFCLPEKKYYANYYIVDVHSNLGSSVIRTAHSRRYIRSFGKLVAKLGDAKDKWGRKVIVVTVKD